MGVPSKGRMQQLLRKHGFMQSKWEEAERHLMGGARYFDEYRGNQYYRPLTTQLVSGQVRGLINPFDTGRPMLKDATRLYLVNVYAAWLVGMGRTPVLREKPRTRDKLLFKEFAYGAMDLMAIGDQDRRLADFWRWRAKQQRNF